MVYRYQKEKIMENPLNIGLSRGFHIYKDIDMYTNSAQWIYINFFTSVNPNKISV